MRSFPARAPELAREGACAPQTLSARRFTRILMDHADVAIANDVCVADDYALRTRASGASHSHRNQITAIHRRSPLGAVVLQLSGRA